MLLFLSHLKLAVKMPLLSEWVDKINPKFSRIQNQSDENYLIASDITIIQIQTIF